MVTDIAPNHLPELRRSQHILEWLQSERARVEAEMVTIAQQWQREESKLRTLLAQGYGITGQFTLDADAGTITTPGDAPNASSAQ